MYVCMNMWLMEEMFHNPKLLFFINKLTVILYDTYLIFKMEYFINP